MDGVPWAQPRATFLLNLIAKYTKPDTSFHAGKNGVRKMDASRKTLYTFQQGTSQDLLYCDLKFQQDRDWLQFQLLSFEANLKI